MNARRDLDAEFAGWAALASRRQSFFPEGLVYVVGLSSLAYVKIGRTNGDVRRRVADLQTASPESLRLVFVLRGGASLEREMHSRFAAHRARGEWFQMAGDVGAFVVYCLVNLIRMEGRAA